MRARVWGIWWMSAAAGVVTAARTCTHTRTTNIPSYPQKKLSRDIAAALGWDAADSAASAFYTAATASNGAVVPGGCIVSDDKGVVQRKSARARAESDAQKHTPHTTHTKGARLLARV